MVEALSARWPKVVKSVARAHGYALFKGLLDRSQRWSADRRDAWVRDELGRTLVGAANVPYYQRVFADAGFDPRVDYRGPEDLAKLPLLTKAQVREARDALVDPTYAGAYLVAKTSGTTGEPMAMRLSERFVAFDSACAFRHLSWAGWRWRDPVVALRSFVPEKPEQGLWRYDRAQNTTYFSAYHLTPANCRAYIDEVLRLRPVILRGYPSSMTLFAEYAYPRREEFSFLKGILCSSETLLPHERETIERTFGKKVFDWYGMTEPALILTECEAHEGMHVNWEYGYGELLPADDLAPDERRLVTTGFHNPVMPFVRYDTGDVVRVFEDGRTCACGRTMPLVRGVAGRKDDVILTPDGRRLPSVNFYTVFRQYTEIARFQLAQYGLRSLVARIEPRRDAAIPPALCDKLAAELRARTGPEVEVEVEVTSKFVTNADGKTPSIVRRPGTRAVEVNEEYTISAQTAWTRHREGKKVRKLDWNEADRVPSPRVRKALLDVLASDEAICWYPNATDPALDAAIAAYAGTSPEHVILVHGSDLAMELVATAFVQTGDRVLLLSPTYDNFRAIVEQHGARSVVFPFDGSEPLDLDALERQIVESTPRILYVNNPNNPIGYVVDRARLEALVALCRKRSLLLIVDEAYIEFGGESVADLVGADAPLIVLRTFSKAFGLAGLRIGYALAGGDVGRALRKVHNPKSVTMLAKAAAKASLEDADQVRAYAAQVADGRRRLYAAFAARGVRYYESGGNYVLFAWPKAGELVRFLEDRDLMVRDRTKYMGNVGHVRVTVGGPDSVDALLAGLDAYFSRAVG